MYLRDAAERMRADRGIYRAGVWAIKRIWYRDWYGVKTGPQAFEELQAWLRENAKVFQRRSGWFCDKPKVDARFVPLRKTCIYCGDCLERRLQDYEEHDRELPVCTAHVARYLWESGRIFAPINQIGKERDK